jgi:hypothetical protein
MTASPSRASTPPASTSSPPASPSRGPLRLRLNGASRAGACHGAWWPQSRDLRTEGRDLVDHFPDTAGYIDRLVFSRPDWDDGGPAAGRGLRRIVARRGPVKIGSFPGDDTQLMILAMADGRRLRLVVIPSATNDELGERLLAQAGLSDLAADA